VARAKANSTADLIPRRLGVQGTARRRWLRDEIRHGDDTIGYAAASSRANAMHVIAKEAVVVKSDAGTPLALAVV